MNYLESAKQYTGNDVDKIFFRPLFSGPSATDLGIRVIYNMPTPTVVQYWDGQRNILKPLDGEGWSGGQNAVKNQKRIDMQRVKAEIAFSAADYYSLVYEKVIASPEVGYEDLTGTVLEQAETEIFKHNIRENLRATMWIGNTKSSSGYNTFDGFLSHLGELVDNEDLEAVEYTYANLKEPGYVVSIFEQLWDNLNERARAGKQEGQLAFFVSSDIYNAYEKYLDDHSSDAAYLGAIEGRQQLMYHGIPVIDVRVNQYINISTVDRSFCLLTDRRNLILAVNTADLPGNEVRMWYNPDEMENRQRAVFLAGTMILDESLLTYAHVVTQ